MKQIIKSFRLNSKGIDDISAEIQAGMKENGVQRENIIRSRLALESLLLDLANHYGDVQEVSITYGSRLGNRFFDISYEGERYDPMNDTMSGYMTDQLMNGLGLTPTWRYRNKKNDIHIRIPRNRIKDEFLLLIALFASVIVGAIGNIMPEHITKNLMQYIFDPVSTLFLNMMTTFAGILIFFSILSGVTGVGNASDFGKIGRYMTGRFIICTVAGTGFSILVLIPVHNLAFGSGGGALRVKEILDLILGIVPSNPIQPFLEGNVLQIVFMAILIGCALMALGRETPDLFRTIDQTNKVLLNVMDMICRLLPLYIFVSISSLIWTYGLPFFKTVWKPVLFIILITHLVLALKLIYVSIKLRVSPFLLAKKILPAYIIGISTASSMAAFGTSLNISDKKLGVPSDLSKMGHPLGNIIYCSAFSSGFVAVIYYLAEINKSNVEISWFIIAWISITIISCAMPPVSGGTLVGIGIMLASVGIPSSQLALAGTLAMLGDFVMTATKISTLHLELVLQADHWKKLDRNILTTK